MLRVASFRQTLWGNTFGRHTVALAASEVEALDDSE
ncbi:hypothetical protein C499_05930 [Halogeometricum borinquense DSM 11551]|nr:hypothetical protein C499_05930 [Halogeometricum borinquense DSM 11551]